MNTPGTKPIVPSAADQVDTGATNQAPNAGATAVLPEHVVEILADIKKIGDKQEQIVGEMEAEMNEVAKVVDEGFRDGVFPLDRSLAENADENLRNLKKFDEETVREEEEQAQEDAASNPQNA